jgi:hypothetical protein
MVRILDSLGNPTLIVEGTGTNGQVTVVSRASNGTFTTLINSCPNAFGVVLGEFDMYINYLSTGQITLYNNGSQVCTFSGNVMNGDNSSTLNEVQFAGPTTQYSAAWSEVIVATGDTRSMARFTAYTTEDGNTTGFLSSNGNDICSSIWNAGQANDANYGYTPSDNILQECTVKNLIPADAYNVIGLTMSARALVGAGGPQHFQFLTRTTTGGSDYTSTNYTPTTSFSNFQNYIQLTNPSTGQAWAITDFENSGFNIGEKSKP